MPDALPAPGVAVLYSSVQHNDLEVRNLRAQLQKKAAERKVEELKQLKAKQQLARATKAKDNADLSDLMALELQQKEKELQAGIQREKIARELKKVPRSGEGYMWLRCALIGVCCAWTWVAGEGKQVGAAARGEIPQPCHARKGEGSAAAQRGTAIQYGRVSACRLRLPMH